VQILYASLYTGPPQVQKTIMHLLFCCCLFVVQVFYTTSALKLLFMALLYFLLQFCSSSTSQVPDPPESALEVFNYSATFTPDPAAGSRGDANTTTSSGTLSLGFTRAVAGTGNLAYHGLASDQTTVLSPWADLIWAVGDSEPTATCEKGKNELLRKGLDRKARNDLQQSKAAVGSHELLQGEGLSYHSNTRGLRVIPWQNPEKYLVDSWKC